MNMKLFERDSLPFLQSNLEEMISVLYVEKISPYISDGQVNDKIEKKTQVMHFILWKDFFRLERQNA